MLQGPPLDRHFRISEGTGMHNFLFHSLKSSESAPFFGKIQTLCWLHPCLAFCLPPLIVSVFRCHSVSYVKVTVLEQWHLMFSATCCPL